MIILSGYKTQTDLNHRCRHTILYHANILSNAAPEYDWTHSWGPASAPVGASKEDLFGVPCTTEFLWLLLLCLLGAATRLLAIGTLTMTMTMPSRFHRDFPRKEFHSNLLQVRFGYITRFSILNKAKSITVQYVWALPFPLMENLEVAPGLLSFRLRVIKKIDWSPMLVLRLLFSLR